MELLKSERRCQPGMTGGKVIEALAKQGTGFHPGALRVLVDALSKEAPEVLGLLDHFGIYGVNIWIFYEFVCLHDISTFIAMLRMSEFGFYSATDFQRLISTKTPVKSDNPFFRILGV